MKSLWKPWVTTLALVGMWLVVGIGSAGAADPVISRVRITDVRDVTFTVSWRTDLVTTGVVQYGTSPSLGIAAQDVRGAGFSGTTHYVTVTGLNPNTPYFFDAVSGSTTDANGGGHYPVTTGPTLSVPGSDAAQGLVFKGDQTTHAVGAIVYVTIKDNDGLGSTGSSAVMSALVDSFGIWNANLGNARTAALSAHFDYTLATGDQLVLSVEGGGDGYATDQTFNLNPHAPAPDLVIDTTPTAITLVSLEARSAVDPGTLLWPGLLMGVLALAGLGVVVTWRARAHARPPAQPTPVASRPK